MAVTRRTFDPPPGVPEYAIPLDRNASAHKRKTVQLTRIYHDDPRDDQPPWQYGSHFIDVGILPNNQIQCAGHLPGFALLPPFNGHDFASNQALCALQLSGGNPAANAGGYCHRNDPTSSAERVVSFADDMTPRLDWTWSGTSGATFFSMASIRFHCWKNCLCIDRTRKKNYLDPQVRMWQYLIEISPKNILSIEEENPFPMGSSTNEKGKPRTSYKGGNISSSECAVTPDRPGTCAIPWPIEILGPVPKELWKISKISPPEKPTAMAAWEPGKLCGNSCAGINDCGADCLCRAPSVLEAISLGVKPLIPLCLDIGTIFGRSLKNNWEIECLCNATYTAPACCESRDGMVFT